VNKFSGVEIYFINTFAGRPPRRCRIVNGLMQVKVCRSIFSAADR
jgi:hypothetical protein